MSDTHDLQAESNQNRINFLRNELSLCFTLASVAETERNSGNNEHAKASLADAEKAMLRCNGFCQIRTTPNTSTIKNIEN